MTPQYTEDKLDDMELHLHAVLESVARAIRLTRKARHEGFGYPEILNRLPYSSFSHAKDVMKSATDILSQLWSAYDQEVELRYEWNVLKMMTTRSGRHCKVWTLEHEGRRFKVTPSWYDNGWLAIDMTEALHDRMHNEYFKTSEHAMKFVENEL